MRYNPWFVSGQWVEAPSWPAIVGGVFLVLTLLAAVVAWAPLARLGPKRAAAPLLGVLGGGVLGVPLAGSPMLVSLTEHLLPGDAIPSAWAHALPLEISAILTVTACAAMGAAAAAAFAGEGASRLIALPALGLGLGTVLPTIGWAGWLLSFGPIPLVRPTPGLVHAGRVARPTAELTGNLDSSWALEPAVDVVAPATAGPLPAQVEATKGPLRTGVACAIEVGLDQDDPRMPLAVGNQWTFASSTEARITIAPLLLGVWDLGSSRTAGTQGVRVTGEREAGPLKFRSVLTTDEQTVEVYGWNGETRTADGVPVFSNGDGGVESTLLPGWICQYAPPEGGTLTLPGPSSCARRKGNAGDYLASAIVGVATVGLLIPDPNATGTLAPMTSGNVK